MQPEIYTYTYKFSTTHQFTMSNRLYYYQLGLLILNEALLLSQIDPQLEQESNYKQCHRITSKQHALLVNQTI